MRWSALLLLALLAAGASADMRRLRLAVPRRERPPAAVPPEAWADLPDRDADGFPDAAELSGHAERAAFRRWTCALALRQARGGLPAEGPLRAARDCADLLNIAVREAFKRHDQRWRDKAGWTEAPPAGDVPGGYPRPVIGTGLFRVAAGPMAPAAFGSYATAEALRELNARRVSRGVERAALEEGDLLFFQHPWQSLPDHGMLVCGDLVVYHTGPTALGPGRVKAVELARLYQHPDPRWRPLEGNPYFLGSYRWTFLD